MQTRRYVSAIVVTGLAAVAALLTGNLIHAADRTAQVPGPGVPAALAPTWTGCCLVDDGTELVYDFRPFDRVLEVAYRASGTFLSVDCALIHPVRAAADPLKTTGPQPHAVDPGKGVAANSNDELPAEEARKVAELEGLFDVAPMGRRVELAAAKDAQGEKGRQVYEKICYACHQPDGRGVPGVFPMLAQSDYLAADRSRAIRIVLQGLSGPVTVNGQTTNGFMPALGADLRDHEIADVLTYVFNAWENPGGAFTADQVEAIRSGKP